MVDKNASFYIINIQMVKNVIYSQGGFDESKNI